MKLQTFRRGTAVAAILTMSLTFAACGEEGDNESSTGGETTSESSEAPETDAGSDAETDGTSEAGGEFDGVFGTACDSLPKDGEPGSLTGMVADPVGTAAASNPLLKTLVAAASAVPGLVDTLNDESAEYTVFAPADSAFEKIPAADLQGLLDGAAEPDSALAVALQHHVLGSRVDADAIVGEQMPLTGDALMIEGDPAADPDGVTVTDGVATAKVLCGGIPTGNATVYVIDTVLTGTLG